MSKVYKLAVLDENGVYRGVVKEVADELLWVRSDGHFPVPDGFDLPPHRYQLRKSTITGKEAFWPLTHEKDEASENTAPSVQVNPVFVARALLKLNRGEKLDAADEATLSAFLTSWDAKGATKQ